jgi:serine/threonine protein kinase/ABC-type branched-subunit amino acid transport system substrate-binding protein
MITLQCLHCGQGLEIANSTSAGENVACPHCGQFFGPLLPSAANTGTMAGVQTMNPPQADRDLPLPEGSNPDLLGSETVLAGIAPLTQHSATDQFSFLTPPRQDDELGWLAHYRVVKVLGRGGMGIVFQAEDSNLQRPVALKVMTGDLARVAAFRQRFLREARATAAIHSDHIVTIHQVGLHNDLPFLAMEFLQGEPLDKWLERLGGTAPPSRPTVDQILRIGRQIALGLEAAHERGLIHRDIKPANIWLETRAHGGKRNEEPQAEPVAGFSSVQPALSFRVKILDFGLARPAQDDAHLTQTGVIMGTPAYMAPEQADGKPVDARSDLFSLGCILYELATGKSAFFGPTALAVLKSVALRDPDPPQAINPSLPPALSDLVMRLLAKTPEDRPASARAVIEAIQAMQAPTPAPPGAGGSGPLPRLGDGAAGRDTPAQQSGRRRRRILGAILGAGLAGLLVLAYLFAIGSFSGTGDKPQGRVSSDIGVTGDEILLGITGPFSGPSRELGRGMELGLQTYFQHVNDQGGIAGRKIKLIALDDGYDPERALANMRELRERRQVFAVIGNVGTPTAEKALPYALQKKILFFGAFTGAKLLRKDPPDRYVFNYRAGYEEETAAIVKYLLEVKRLSPAQLAVFAQQDGYGNAGADGVFKTLRQRGYDPATILRVGYARNTTQVGGAVRQIVSHNEVRAVIMVAAYRAAAKFIQQVKKARPDMMFTNVSFVGSEALAEELREYGPGYTEGVIVTQVVPHIDSQSTAVLKYRALLRKYFPNEAPSFISLEGYVAAVLFVEGLRRAGEDLTTASLIDALESIHDLDLGTGAAIRFGPSEHQGSHKVWGSVFDKAGHNQMLALD